MIQRIMDTEDRRDWLFLCKDQSKEASDGNIGASESHKFNFLRAQYSKGLK